MAQKLLPYLNIFFVLARELKAVALPFDLEANVPGQAGENCLQIWVFVEERKMLVTL